MCLFDNFEIPMEKMNGERNAESKPLKEWAVSCSQALFVWLTHTMNQSDNILIPVVSAITKMLWME